MSASSAGTNYGTRDEELATTFDEEFETESDRELPHAAYVWCPFECTVDCF